MVKSIKQTRQPNKRKMHTQEMIIAALRTSAGIITLASAKLGVTRSALHGWINDEPGLQEALLEIRHINVDLSEAVILKLIKEGDREAAKFYLRCFGKDRGWVEVFRTQVEATFRLEENARAILESKIDRITSSGGEEGVSSGPVS